MYKVAKCKNCILIMVHSFILTIQRAFNAQTGDLTNKFFEHYKNNKLKLTVQE